MKKHLLTLTALATITFGATTQANASTYTVQPGDNLTTIALEQNIPIESLYSLNQLATDMIHPGQNLTISDKVKKHTVTPGENLPLIAKTYNIPLSTLMSDNNLTGFLIHPGDKLSINTKSIIDSEIPVQPTSVNKPSTATKTAPKTIEKTTVQKTASDTKPVANGKSFTVSATAYTASCAGCSGVTRTGIDLKKNPHLKVIAVDPSVIPLGSRVYVEGYGEAIAGDTGGAIKNNKIDVFVPNKSDALNWGRKNVKITILD